ncbi:MAG TPA: hypothetical protein VHC20_00615 [Candidatus Paceibacterota bacterium]|nr:hypothetical protein [Candidatus Paceibacterota bacterium]
MTTTYLPAEVLFFPALTFMDPKTGNTKSESLGKGCKSAEEAFQELLTSFDRLEELCPPGFTPWGSAIHVLWSTPSLRNDGEIKPHFWPVPKEHFLALGERRKAG